jgi:hypothetical protein
MKHFLLSIVVALAICATAFGDEAKKNSVALVRAGDMDEALVRRAQEWAQQNTAISVTLLDAQPAGKGPLNDQGHELAKLLGPDDIGLVALVSADEDVKDAMVLLQDAPVVVVNVNALKEGVSGDDMLARRVEREVMRGIGLIMGLEQCPDPFCVMTVCPSIPDLDQMGRNFCPPCLSRIQTKARASGIEINLDSGFNMIGSGPE